MKRLLYFSPFARGGLADYAHAQANALAELGAEVTLLAPQSFSADKKNYALVSKLCDAGDAAGVSGKIQRAKTILENINILARFIRDEKFSHVLFGSYFEYLAPIWSWKLERLARSGIIFGAVVHDPVRDFALGPQWWHRWSIARGYSFLREAFVHEPIALDTTRPMPRLRTTTIPHGLFEFPPPLQSREAARARFGLPPDAPVMLAFGHIRDGKNLDLVLRAMEKFPNLCLLVAGAPQSSGQKPAEFYQNLARELEIAHRCVWKIAYVTREDAGNFFVASDVALLTYSRAFRSASGVLGASVFFRKPCIASGGEGNLRTTVQKFDLGVWVEPDNLDALVRGIERWLQSPPKPRWDDYLSENSWQKNAEIVLRRFFEP